ncbi:MAG: RNA methyltransferase [Gemmatimonadaceae bacterium]|nr:RNA methyltransferase [Gemmatimonadaceae bacterium]
MSAKLLTLARDLQRRKARERQQLFVCEGVRATEELMRSPLDLHGVLISPALLGAARGAALREAIDARGIAALELDEADFASAASTDAPQGVLAIGAIPEMTVESLALPSRARLLVLDAVQDPGNAGTMLRTSAALGASATLAAPGTVDLWNAKVVRSAMGALFHYPALAVSWSDLDTLLASNDIPLWGADVAGQPIETIAPPTSVALAVGNEGAGLSDDARSRCARLVGISLAPEIESLNVAVAAGILLHHFRE